jgi:hypothetical protein
MLLHGMDAEGELVPVGSDGVLGAPISFPGGGFDCLPLWVTGSSFYFSCEGDGVLSHGTVDGSTLVTEVVREGVFPRFARAPSGRCAVNSSLTEIALVSLASGYEETLRVASDGPGTFVFPADDSGFAWTESNAVRWQAWDDSCQGGDGGFIPLGTSASTIAILP